MPMWAHQCIVGLNTVCGVWWANGRCAFDADRWADGKCTLAHPLVSDTCLALAHLLVSDALSIGPSVGIGYTLGINPSVGIRYMLSIGPPAGGPMLSVYLMPTDGPMPSSVKHAPDTNKWAKWAMALIYTALPGPPRSKDNQSNMVEEAVGWLVGVYRPSFRDALSTSTSVKYDE
ncbi:hypothetical protein BD769DRAFT_1381905 [Suillus cothurnatus]|nr:hypothetical protein BD769DRAFT_1381905 [Suillus cothurnatus]